MEESFIQNVLRFYGESGSLSTGNLENFLRLITSRRAPSVDADANPLKNTECSSLSELLSAFGLSNTSAVSLNDLEMMCPAILNQVLLPACPYTSPSNHNDSSLLPDHKVWGYGFLAVTVINLAALLGLFLVPLTKKTYFPKVLTYFIGLAIGTLFSNAVLQLIPEALGLDPKDDNYVLNVVGIFGGFYILFFTERVLKMVLKADTELGHSHSPPLQSADVTITTFSNDVVINSISGDIVTNNTTHEMNSINEKFNNPSESPAVEQNACVLLTCRWLKGEGMSNIKTVAWMITVSDAVHNFIDGLAIGASFTLSLLTGFSTSIAIFCEEFPHELGDFVILLNSGMSVGQAACFNLLSAMSCYLGLALGILLGSSFAPNAIFAIAGGMFLYISLADMFPEMNSIMATHSKGFRGRVAFFLIQNAGLFTGFTVILLITLFAGDINLG
ncbi:zinc transporter ZIP8-like [Sinocyclocheilus rhinocerous]|uniref:zinc transporter ZIP8-like n=1 Tax=Sinocyclocheilus rhinocerous TaxID=307959 RepID=UPI0007B8991D|nr:PREDICTED: zinc transporter ZIP8-like [Sinocyclocheilus rhinocerous]